MGLIWFAWGRTLDCETGRDGMARKKGIGKQTQISSLGLLPDPGERHDYRLNLRRRGVWLVVV